MNFSGNEPHSSFPEKVRPDEILEICKVYHPNLSVRLTLISFLKTDHCKRRFHGTFFFKINNKIIYDRISKLRHIQWFLWWSWMRIFRFISKAAQGPVLVFSSLFLCAFTDWSRWVHMWRGKQEAKTLVTRKMLLRRQYKQLTSSFSRWRMVSYIDVSHTVFTRISAALIKFFSPNVRRLIEGGAYLKIGRYKEIFPFNFTLLLSFVRKKYSYI